MRCQRSLRLTPVNDAVFAQLRIYATLQLRHCRLQRVNSRSNGLEQQLAAMITGHYRLKFVIFGAKSVVTIALNNSVGHLPEIGSFNVTSTTNCNYVNVNGANCDRCVRRQMNCLTGRYINNIGLR